MLKQKRYLVAILGLAVFGLGYAAGQFSAFESVAQAQGERIFEMRTYTALPGRLDALNARFRNHTTRIFEKHGMTNIGYWTPQEAPLAENTLVYILAHDSRDAGQASWDAVRADPEWARVSEESQRDGRIVEGVDVLWLEAPDYSKIK
ncbi:MAG: NIPSNAP family protein [Acidobacteria bacterium]|nr:NIPSNAP family protein [Acidobacteriota bacterium]